MPKVSFKTLPVGDLSPDYLDNLSVSVDYQASQTAISGGIGFTLIFENASAADIEIFNPYDVIAYTLVDAVGWPVNLDTPASRLVANVSPAFLSQKNEYLKITRIVSGGSEKVIETEVGLDRIIIPPQSSYAYAVQIDKMIPHSEQVNASHKSKDKINLPAGKYGITLTLPLISFVGKQEHSRILQSPEIAINLSARK